MVFIYYSFGSQVRMWPQYSFTLRFPNEKDKCIHHPTIKVQEILKAEVERQQRWPLTWNRPCQYPTEIMRRMASRYVPKENAVPFIYLRRVPTIKIQNNALYVLLWARPVSVFLFLKTKYSRALPTSHDSFCYINVTLNYYLLESLSGVKERLLFGTSTSSSAKAVLYFLRMIQIDLSIYCSSLFMQ